MTHATLTDGTIAWAISAGLTLVPLIAAGLIVAAGATAPGRPDGASGGSDRS